MNNLKEIASNYGKLFYLITYLSKIKRISKEERVRLKGKLAYNSARRTHYSGR